MENEKKSLIFKLTMQQIATWLLQMLLVFSAVAALIGLAYLLMTHIFLLEFVVTVGIIAILSAIIVFCARNEAKEVANIYYENKENNPDYTVETAKQERKRQLEMYARRPY